jgi:TolB protein
MGAIRLAREDLAMEDESNDRRPVSYYRWLAGIMLLMASCLLIAAGVLAASQWWAGRGAATVGSHPAPPAAALPTTVAPAAAPEEETAAPAVEEENSPATPAGVAATMGDSRIAFVSPEGRIGTVAAAGGDERLISDESAVLLFPAWSPDGRSLAAVGSTSEGPGVFAVADSEGAALTPLYVNRQGAPVYLYWSPDGDTVSFIANHDEGLGLFLAPADGGEEARLLATGAPFYWQWAEGGEEVLIHTGASAPGARIAFLDVAGGEPGADLGAAGFFQAPGISGDGRFLAWAEVDGTGSRWLVVRGEENGDDLRLPHRGSIAMSWSPSPDRNLLAFISPAVVENEPAFSHYGPLRLLDATTGEVELLSDLTVLAFFWSPDGRSIAYITVDGRDDGMQATGQLTNVAFRRSEPAAQHENVRLALWVVDVDSGVGRQRLIFQPTSIYLTQFLPFFDQYALSHRIWSPDAAALVLPIAGDAPADDTIYVVPTHEGRPYAVAKGTVAFWSP